MADVTAEKSLDDFFAKRDKKKKKEKGKGKESPAGPTSAVVKKTKKEKEKSAKNENQDDQIDKVTSGTLVTFCFISVSTRLLHCVSRSVSILLWFLRLCRFIYKC